MAANTTHANNTIKTRIQLKSDTEENWNKAGPKEGSAGFVPLLGELIVYSADATHPFSRLKIGDGSTNVVSLPFIDSGTINGEEVEIYKANTFNDLPSPGSSDKLYVDLATNRIYHYTGAAGYKQLSNFSFTLSKSTVNSVIDWGPGRAATSKIENNTLKITNGIAPQLFTSPVVVVTDVQKEVAD